MARPNWSRLLPRPLVIPTVMHLSTLAEVRALLDRHLPAQTGISRLGGMSERSSPRQPMEET
jgi:hypothetical protein